jgi:hypothetical protein
MASREVVYLAYNILSIEEFSGWLKEVPVAMS